jgi:hypothetical protein
METIDCESWLQRYGFQLNEDGAAGARKVLRSLVESERSSQGTADTELMRLLCVQLFAMARPDDSVLIAEAREASFDAGASIGISLLCGAGVEKTLQWLDHEQTEATQRASAAIRAAVSRGDFDGFDPAEELREYRSYWCSEVDSRDEGGTAN